MSARPDSTSWLFHGKVVPEDLATIPPIPWATCCYHRRSSMVRFDKVWTWPHAMIPLTKSPEQGDPGKRFLFLTPAAEGSRPYSRTICPHIVLVLSTCSPFLKEDGSAALSGLLCLFSRLLLKMVSTVHSEAVHTPRIFSLIIRCWCMQHSQWYDTVGLPESQTYPISRPGDCAK